MGHVLHLNAYAAYAPARPGLVARLREALANHREFARIRDELDALTDAELGDIGLSRHNLADVARTAVYGR